MADSPLKTTLYLIRHGEPAAEFLERYYGQMDVPLSERGKRQSHAVAERLSGVPFDAIYSSDLERAAYLAEAVAAKFELPVRRLEAFRERRMGIFQGLTLDEMRERDPEAHAGFLADRALHPVEGAENFEMLRDRVVPAFLELAESFSGGRVLVATHAGPIRVMIAHVLQMPLSRCFHLTLDHACVNVIEFPAGGEPKVKLING